MNIFTWPIAFKLRAACQNSLQKWKKPRTADSRHSRPETVAWAIPAGLALATGKDAYQFLHLHNLTTSLALKWWRLNCPTRTKEPGYRPTRVSKEKQSNGHEQWPRKASWHGKGGSLFEGEKAGSRILLLLLVLWLRHYTTDRQSNKGYQQWVNHYTSYCCF